LATKDDINMTAGDESSSMDAAWILSTALPSGSSLGADSVHPHFVGDAFKHGPPPRRRAGEKREDHCGPFDISPHGTFFQAKASPPESPNTFTESSSSEPPVESDAMEIDDAEEQQLPAKIVIRMKLSGPKGEGQPARFEEVIVKPPPVVATSNPN
jgi:hypothetical protein